MGRKKVIIRIGQGLALLFVLLSLGFLSTFDAESFVLGLVGKDEEEKVLEVKSDDSRTGEKLTEEEVKRLAEELIKEGFLPAPEVCAAARPYQIKGRRLAVDQEGINFLISQDPAYPNGIDENEKPIIPSDLNSRQREIYINVLYGGILDWKKVAQNPAANSKALGVCLL